MKIITITALVAVLLNLTIATNLRKKSLDFKKFSNVNSRQWRVPDDRLSQTLDSDRELKENDNKHLVIVKLPKDQNKVLDPLKERILPLYPNLGVVDSINGATDKRCALDRLKSEHSALTDTDKSANSARHDLKETDNVGILNRKSESDRTTYWSLPKHSGRYSRPKYGSRNKFEINKPKWIVKITPPKKSTEDKLYNLPVDSNRYLKPTSNIYGRYQTPSRSGYYGRSKDIEKSKGIMITDFSKSIGLDKGRQRVQPLKITPSKPKEYRNGFGYPPITLYGDQFSSMRAISKPRQYVLPKITSFPSIERTIIQKNVYPIRLIKRIEEKYKASLPLAYSNKEKAVNINVGKDTPLRYDIEQDKDKNKPKRIDHLKIIQSGETFSGSEPKAADRPSEEGIRNEKEDNENEEREKIELPIKITSLNSQGLVTKPESLAEEVNSNHLDLNKNGKQIEHKQIMVPEIDDRLLITIKINTSRNTDDSSEKRGHLKSDHVHIEPKNSMLSASYNQSESIDTTTNNIMDMEMPKDILENMLEHYKDLSVDEEKNINNDESATNYSNDSFHQREIIENIKQNNHQTQSTSDGINTVQYKDSSFNGKEFAINSDYNDVKHSVNSFSQEEILPNNLFNKESDNFYSNHNINVETHNSTGQVYDSYGPGKTDDSSGPDKVFYGVQVRSDDPLPDIFNYSREAPRTLIASEDFKHIPHEFVAGQYVLTEPKASANSELKEDNERDGIINEKSDNVYSNHHLAEKFQNLTDQIFESDESGKTDHNSGSHKVFDGGRIQGDNLSLHKDAPKRVISPKNKKERISHDLESEQYVAAERKALHNSGSITEKEEILEQSADYSVLGKIKTSDDDNEIRNEKLDNFNHNLMKEFQESSDQLLNNDASGKAEDNSGPFKASYDVPTQTDEPLLGIFNYPREATRNLMASENFENISNEFVSGQMKNEKSDNFHSNHNLINEFQKSTDHVFDNDASGKVNGSSGPYKVLNGVSIQIHDPLPDIFNYSREAPRNVMAPENLEHIPHEFVSGQYVMAEPSSSFRSESMMGEGKMKTSNEKDESIRETPRGHPSDHRIDQNQSGNFYSNPMSSVLPTALNESDHMSNRKIGNSPPENLNLTSKGKREYFLDEPVQNNKLGNINNDYSSIEYEDINSEPKPQILNFIREDLPQVRYPSYRNDALDNSRTLYSSLTDGDIEHTVFGARNDHLTQDYSGIRPYEIGGVDFDIGEKTGLERRPIGIDEYVTTKKVPGKYVYLSEDNNYIKEANNNGLIDEYYDETLLENKDVTAVNLVGGTTPLYDVNKTHFKDNNVDGNNNLGIKDVPYIDDHDSQDLLDKILVHVNPLIDDNGRKSISETNRINSLESDSENIKSFDISGNCISCDKKTRSYTENGEEFEEKTVTDYLPKTKKVCIIVDDSGDISKDLTNALFKILINKTLPLVSIVEPSENNGKITERKDEITTNLQPSNIFKLLVGYMNNTQTREQLADNFLDLFSKHKIDKLDDDSAIQDLSEQSSDRREMYNSEFFKRKEEISPSNSQPPNLRELESDQYSKEELDT